VGQGGHLAGDVPAGVRGLVIVLVPKERDRLIRALGILFTGADARSSGS
jgi:hypothetical protein